MAITRAQQAKQLLANGGRIGLKAGAQFDTSLGGGAISPGTDISGQFRGGDGSGDGNRNKLTTTVKDLGKEVLPYVIGGPLGKKATKIKGLIDLFKNLKNVNIITPAGAAEMTEEEPPYQDLLL